MQVAGVVRLVYYVRTCIVRSRNVNTTTTRKYFSVCNLILRFDICLQVNHKMGDSTVYPNDLCVRNLLHYGSTGLILYDDRSGTIVKWPVDDDHSHAVKYEEGIYAIFAKVGGDPGLLRYLGAVEGRGLRLEFARGGDLRTFLQQRGIGHPETLQWMVQIARSLRFVHAQRVVHGDVSLRHVLLDAQRFGKLADFSRSSFHSSSSTTLYQRDLFGLGSAMYELQTGTLPFAGLAAGARHARFARGIFPDLASLGKLGDIITGCWRGTYDSTETVVKDLEGEMTLERVIGAFPLTARTS